MKRETKQNITLRLDKTVVRRARVVAAKKHMSISSMFAEALARIVEQAERYEQAKTDALADLEAGFHFGGRITRFSRRAP